MSMILCQQCGKMIDSDDDPACFIEIGRRHTIAVCAPCRDEQRREEEAMQQLCAKMLKEGKKE